MFTVRVEFSVVAESVSQIDLFDEFLGPNDNKIRDDLVNSST